MEILGEIYEKDLGEAAAKPASLRYEFRRAARALVFDKKGRIAILSVPGKGYHKLPGGGVEEGEEVQRALEREVLEETGYGAEIRPQALGAVVECRDQDGLLQLSYCYLADATGEPGETHLTELEREHGFQLRWLSLEEAIGVLERDTPADLFEKFIRARDLIFLRKAREIITV
jgi:ADP-ribose pyrophosphatase YjhB (NUDIX family)